MIYLAYYVSTHHHYGESGATQHEHLVDADADQFALIRRVNEHYALPETIRSHRGTRHEIPAFASKSKPTYCGGGGGTDFTSYVEIRRAPTLVKTHRAREALWHGRRDAQGKFPPDQKFGEWFLITAQQAEIYGQRDNYEIEPLAFAGDAGVAQPEGTGWVSVGVRKPPHEADVLVYSISRGQKIACYDQHSGHWFTENAVRLLDVTHWMPKPSDPTPVVIASGNKAVGGSNA